jgi:hypothetical protein
MVFGLALPAGARNWVKRKPQRSALLTAALESRMDSVHHGRLFIYPETLFRNS